MLFFVLDDKFKIQVLIDIIRHDKDPHFHVEYVTQQFKEFICFTRLSKEVAYDI